MKYIKLFESLSSDRRAFKNWLTKIDNNQFDEELFSLFIKHRPKLEDKNIFNYKNKESLIQSIEQVSKYVTLKKFEKDLRNWEKIGLNCDVLYKDDNYVILHAKDFKSEQKLGSGCRICTNHQSTYDGYIKSGAYFFDILDLKNNERYFGTYTHTAGFQKGKRYNIVDKNDNMFIAKDWDGEKWIEDNTYNPGLPENHEFIKICENILEEKFLK
jgi:hypothetical protein